MMPKLWAKLMTSHDSKVFSEQNWRGLRFFFHHGRKTMSLWLWWKTLVRHKNSELIPLSYHHSALCISVISVSQALLKTSMPASRNSNFLCVNSASIAMPSVVFKKPPVSTCKHLSLTLSPFYISCFYIRNSKPSLLCESTAQPVSDLASTWKPQRSISCIQTHTHLELDVYLLVKEFIFHSSI